MPLDDLTPQNNNEDSNKSEGKKYTRISDEDMMEFFDERSENWGSFPHRSKEMVYGTREFAPMNDDLMLLCFTTIDMRTNISRDKGADAIRLVAWHIPIERPVSGRKKTLRIETWRKNLGNKIDSIMDDGESIVTLCDECGSPMVERQSEYGKFLGCISYPDCKNTENIDD